MVDDQPTPAYPPICALRPRRNDYQTRSLDSVLDRNLYITQHGISPGYAGTVVDANHTATFVFSGLTGVTEADIASEVMFVLGRSLIRQPSFRSRAQPRSSEWVFWDWHHGAGPWAEKPRV